MRLAELSEHSGVSTATIKYYLREGLLPPGERVSATRSEYGEEHLRRLRLVRALIQVGRVPVSVAREVLAVVEDTELDQHARLGAATWALGAEGSGDREGGEGRPAAETQVAALIRELGWEDTATAESPAHRTLVDAVDALQRLGYPCDATHLRPYAQLASQLAVHDLDVVEEYEEPDEQVEAAVALTVLYEPVLLSLRRLAHAEESARRFTS